MLRPASHHASTPHSALSFACPRPPPFLALCAHPLLPLHVPPTQVTGGGSKTDRDTGGDGSFSQWYHRYSGEENANVWLLFALSRLCLPR